MPPAAGMAMGRQKSPGRIKSCYKVLGGLQAVAPLPCLPKVGRQEVSKPPWQEAFQAGTGIWQLVVGGAVLGIHHHTSLGPQVRLKVSPSPLS